MKKKCKHGCGKPPAFERNECYTCRSRNIMLRKPVDMCYYFLKKSAKKRHLDFTITLQFRPALLKRANNCCEECGVPNYAYGYRVDNGFIELPKEFNGFTTVNGFKVIQIILTIAHLDHDPSNWNVSYDRLKALCQKCHLNYDRK